MTHAGITVAERFPDHIAVDPAVIGILERLETAGFETWCVGGAIRDVLVGGRQQDFDLATAAPPSEVQQLFRRTVPVGIAHGTVGVLDEHGTMHEVTTFRRDVRTDGRHAVVEFGQSLADDLDRRDFTINAIAYHPVRHEWRDPHNGLADLQRRVVRTVGDAATRFREDRLRVLRALRFAARLDFTVEPATWQAIVAAAPDTGHLAAERVHDEWIKGIATARSVPTLVELWIRSGVASVWLPDCAVPAASADRREDPAPMPVRDAVVVTARYCRDSVRVWRGLKGSAAEIRRAEAIARGPAAPAAAEPRDVRRWLATVTTAAADLQALARWENPSAAWIAVMDEVLVRGDPTSRTALAVTGDDLLRAGVPPGRDTGAMLATLLDAVIDDPGRNTRDSLLSLVRQRLQHG